jgi:hypothetical protein
MKKLLVILLLLFITLGLAACETKQDDNTHTLTLYNNGGTPATFVITFESMSPLKDLTRIPVRPGYIFGGYFTVNKCPSSIAEWEQTGLFDRTGESFLKKYNHDVSGYACWET